MHSLRRISEALVRARPEVEGVALFGSLARGDYGLRSDADLLVSLRSAAEKRIADRIPRYLAAYLEAPVPVDLLPLTAEEICRRIQSAGAFWRRIRREAILLAGTLPGCMDNPGSDRS